MAAILDVIRALRSSQPPTIVRRRQTRVSRFVLSRRRVRGFKRELRFCHRRRLRVNIDVSSSLVPPFTGWKCPSRRRHVAIYTRIDNLRAQPSRQPDTFSCAYCYDSHGRPSPTDSPLNTYSLLSSILFHVVIFRTISLAISTNRAKLARDTAAISIQW